jgi:RNA polymerase sigma-B factor
VRHHDTHDAAARDALAMRFLPVARQLARRYSGGPEPFDDLCQVASVGLLEAIDRFDPSRGTQFRSFAVPTIVGELKRHFRDTAWAVRVPRGLQEPALRVERVTHELERELGRPPTTAQIAARAGLTMEEALAAREAARAQRGISLDAPGAGDDAGAVLAGRLDIDEHGLGRVGDAVTIERLMDALSDRERESFACASRTTSRRPRSASASASRRCRSRGSSARPSGGCARRRTSRLPAEAAAAPTWASPRRSRAAS